MDQRSIGRVLHADYARQLVSVLIGCGRRHAGQARARVELGERVVRGRAGQLQHLETFLRGRAHS